MVALEVEVEEEEVVVLDAIELHVPCMHAYKHNMLGNKKTSLLVKRY